jgi:hypothetical protein
MGQCNRMLHHLNLATGTAVGYCDLPDESYLLSRTLFKWLLVGGFSEQPKGLQSINFKIPPTERFDFEHKKSLLLEIINKACSNKTAANWGSHPYFGCMSTNECGGFLTAHIDYHLKQFSL